MAEKKSLADRLRGASVIEETALLSKSKFFNEKDMITMPIPMMNMAAGGSVTGGFSSGLHLWCGPSKHFKSLFSLIQVKAYMDKYPDAICLFYDSEFGTPKAYFEALDIDMDRVVHIPIVNMEKLKFDFTKQLDEIKREDHVIVFVDSVGNLASVKEVEDAEEGKSTVDMTRAKVMKSIFRIFTPWLTLKDIPMIVVNHTYKEMTGKYAKTIVSGGTGIYLSADNIYIIGRSQEKEDDDLSGYKFTINIEKSRHVKEKSKFPITVTFDGGLNKWSGLFDLCYEELELIVSQKKGWYNAVDIETGEIVEPARRKDAFDKASFWQPLLDNPAFQKKVREMYQVSNKKLIQSDGQEVTVIGSDEDDED